MPNKIRFCIICKRYDRKTRSSYTRVCTAEREARLLEGYRRRYNGEELSQPILNQLVHQKCYNKLVQGVSSNNESIESNDILTSNEQKPDDNDEELDQTSLIQFRSRMPLPSNVNRHLFERRQRVCAVCNRYAYRAHNRMKQIVSNFMANKLAEGFSYIHKRPYGRSLLDAYIHETCFRKLYSSYRYHTAKKFINRDQLPYRTQFTRGYLYSPHETRSRTNVNKSSLDIESEQSTPRTTDDTANLSIESLFSTSFYTSIATANPSVELSARSGLFRPCIERLAPEEIEFYTKRNRMVQQTNSEDNSLITRQEPIVRSFITLSSSAADSNRDDTDNDMQVNEQDMSLDWTPTYLSTPHSVSNARQKICTAAKIRRRYLKPPPLAKPTNPLIADHTYISHIPVQKTPPNLEKLYQWLTEQLKLSGTPMSMGDVLTKYKEIINEENLNNNISTARDSVCRDRLKHNLDKFYTNQFVFVTPNKREGTFIALNDIEHYIRLSIKNTKQEKEKAAEASILSSIVVTPTPVDHKRQTCETVMNGIRKIRLYIRDPKTLQSIPPLLIRNLIGLITTSEKQFNKVSQQYDFYRMIDEDLFDNPTAKLPNKVDKNMRNMSLAADLIGARHDNRLSEKQFLLADEFTKKDFNCTPKQVISLLNQYGHTCSYKSYLKMKALKQQTASELGEELIQEIENMIRNDEKSSDSDIDLLEL